MSELLFAESKPAKLRWELLTTVSAIALAGVVSALCSDTMADEESGRPTVWIELGAQMERMDYSEDRLAPPFVLALPRPDEETIAPLSVERPPRYAIGGEGKISFQPEGSDWVFSAGVRYGRANSNKHVHQQTYHIPTIVTFYGSHVQTFYLDSEKFIDTNRVSRNSHLVLDFQAGRDVGLGLFGKGSSSLLSLGVRFAQFTSSANIAIASDPDFAPVYKYRPNGIKLLVGEPYHINTAHLDANRSFHGIGPSLTWSASVPLSRGDDDELAFDWGVNAAVLFGRQKARVQHQTTSEYHYSSYKFVANNRYVVYQRSGHRASSRSVVVPNFGGFAGLSFRYSAAKVSFGYRADMFFHAIEGGIDTPQSQNIFFHGPYATISIGFP